MSKRRGFVVDDKFPDVTACLEKAGWTACPHHTYPTCLFRYTNYVKIQWKFVKPHQTINHLENAILLSRKHELLRHLEVRRGHAMYYPRSTTSIETWFRMFLYTQALLVLKNPSTYPAMLPMALAIGLEIQRLNDKPREARAAGLCLMEDAFLEDHADAIGDWVNQLDPVAPRGTLMRETAPDVVASIGGGGGIHSNPPSLDALLLHLEACDPQFHFISTRNIWIAKPSGLSQGRGIELIASRAQLEAFKAGHEDKAVVIQQYVERPFLILGRKFDIRQWVLVTATAPLTIYWYRECYLRFSSKAYSLAADDAIHDKYMHLCNNSIQKTGDAPDHPDIPGNMWGLDRFQLHLSELGVRDRWDNHTVPAMQHACVEALQSVQPKLKRIGHGFEWLGLDFILDEQLTPWLLEVNVSPDVSHSTDTTAALVPRATASILECKMVLGKSMDNQSEYVSDHHHATVVSDDEWSLIWQA
ncbi:Aste57867_21307 [Aphanomyces stellatus]|uniref:Aste57867_21307 protein n=1 Tax=Aphanomyces stellatus TaxID=120398 RepID=A0A485LLS2_9STRA|nr:hypothetical protein As57867_021238 [Aphanomyces stellatus]VFT97979.1 Aste57867_21307 [Aphanomyces stellatus]